jgi:rhodanese-related sulfurtransferase
MAWHMFSRFGAGSDSDIVDFGDLAEAVATNAWKVVDVREPHEFAAGHIPNALNIPMSVFDPKRLPHGKPVVLISQSGERSRNALSNARAIGRDDVRHFAGGMNACGLNGAVPGERTAGTFQFKLELDQRESRTVGYCLLACRSRLIETIGDTTRPAASRRIGSRELELVESVLRKLLAVEMQQKLSSGTGLNHLESVKLARFGDPEPCPRMFDDPFLRLDSFADPPVNDH